MTSPDRGYEAALAALSTLITRRKRADGSNWGDAFSLMQEYFQVTSSSGRSVAQTVVAFAHRTIHIHVRI